MLALLAAALFQLWDGRMLPAQEWLRHGDEYVVTLGDGSTLILREQEVKDVQLAGPGPFHFAVSIHDDAQKDEHAQMGRDVLLLRLR